ncbi:MAG: flavodoxin family protein, partial [Candidatus Electrothrix sp. AUS1_2]|nr:flavodoxin family protein [Candidatus Electrothrix sp. AUS1_2]
MLSKKKIIILDGTYSHDEHAVSILSLLKGILAAQEASIQIFTLRDIKINHCIGCFDCWLKTPGKCIYNDDPAKNILQDIITSDIVILFTPVVFGGYSSELKKILERLLPVALPFLEKIHDEVHHPRRYPSFPHIIGIGTYPVPNSEITICFQILVGRTSLNAGTSYSADVFCHSESSESLQRRLLKLLSEKNNLPGQDELCTMAKAARPQKISIENRKALLIIGSPKNKLPSTSEVLGGYLL